MKTSKSNKIILKNNQLFANKHVCFSGNIQDISAIQISTLSTKINILNFHYWLFFKKKISDHVYFGFIQHLLHVNTLIYFWPKNKIQAIFQLRYLIAKLPYNSQIFIAGENTSGVKSSIYLLNNWIILKKIDSARKSCLITGILKKQFRFNILNFFKTYIWNNIIIQVLPGVFGYHGVDPGSLLLMSTFKANIYGKVLDIGSGSGILGVLLIKQSKKKINLTLSDINSEALISSKKTLESNNISGNVIASDLFSHITNKFNLIISNPPLHDDLKFSQKTIKELIQKSVHYLHNKGELRIVVSNFLSYSKKIKKSFGNCSILKSTNCFKVYQAFLVNKLS